MNAATSVDEPRRRTFNGATTKFISSFSDGLATLSPLLFSTSDSSCNSSLVKLEYTNTI